MENTLTPAIENRIFTIRGTQVMMDRDLAAVYDVSTTRLNEQVSRNLRRFPETFCFYLTKEELQFWISQNATSKSIKIGLRKPPRVFTEYGVAMVSSIINSQRAVEVSVQIVQAFVFMKKAMMQGNLLSHRLANTEQMLVFHERKIEDLYKRMEGIELPKHGIFFNNQIFDAYVFFSELVQKATSSIILIDNYIDHTVLLQLAKRAEGVSATIYTEHIPSALRLDLEKHNAQYPAIEIQRIQHIHDRFLIIDEKELYHIGASIKDLGKKWFAFSRMDSLAGEVLRRITQRDKG
jgi:ORF6N domain